MRRPVISFLASMAMLLLGLTWGFAQPPLNPEEDPTAIFPPEGVYLREGGEVQNLDLVCGLIRIPADIRKARVKGRALIRIAIRPDGSYAGHKVIRSPHPSFTHEIERHLPHLRFSAWDPDRGFNRVWIMIPFALDLSE